MSQSDYYVQYLITVNPDLLNRCAASAATEADRADLAIGPPDTWAYEHRWDYAVTPGWVAAVASATTGGNTDWGKDGSVLTDPMILSRTQQLLDIA